MLLLQSRRPPPPPRWLTPLVVGLVLMPGSARAQLPTAPPADSVHVVRDGDTLWDLAARYTGNPFRWSDLHGLNREVVADPHLIYPGERLRLPGAPVPVDVVATPATYPPADVGAVTVRPANGVISSVASAPAPAVDELGAGRVVPDSLRRLRRQADYVAAPYLAQRGGPIITGRINGVPGVVSGVVGERWLQLGDEVRLALPPGVAPVAGQRFVAHRLGALLASGGQVVRPTGIVEITGASDGVTRGRVVVVLDQMTAGQAIVPMPIAGDAAATSPAGTAARVISVVDGAVLPSLNSWLLLAPRAGGALAEGDAVRFVRPLPEVGGVGTAGEELLGHARVVRVTPLGASAMITQIERPPIGVGTTGHVIEAAAP